MCNGCPNRWNGHNTCHCASCHETFTTITAFDKHRAGSHPHDTRHCLDPEAAGLVLADRAYRCWARPYSTDSGEI